MFASLVFAVVAVLTLLLSLGVGTAAIYLAASFVLGVEDVEHAFWTALLGAGAWILASLVFGWIPLLGTLFALLCWVFVVQWRYRCDLREAALLGAVAFAVSFVVTLLLPVGAMGVPFV